MSGSRIPPLIIVGHGLCSSEVKIRICRSAPPFQSDAPRSLQRFELMHVRYRSNEHILARHFRERAPSRVLPMRHSAGKLQLNVSFGATVTDFVRNGSINKL